MLIVVLENVVNSLICYSLNEWSLMATSLRLHFKFTQFDKITCKKTVALFTCLHAQIVNAKVVKVS